MANEPLKEVKNSMVGMGEGIAETLEGFKNSYTVILKLLGNLQDLKKIGFESEDTASVAQIEQKSAQPPQQLHHDVQNNEHKDENHDQGYGGPE